MPTYESVNKIIQESSNISLDEDFVGIAVSLDSKGEAFHCGLAVNYNKNIKLFHFDLGDGDKIKLEDLSKSQSIYFLIKLPIIKSEEVEAFLSKCELILDKELDLQFGFFYNGEFFDQNNNLIYKLENHNVTNCVFFCITIITGFLVGGVYFNFEDWKEDNFSTNWFENFLLKSSYRKVTKEQLQGLMGILRRIPPHDYFSSGEIKALPITKKAVLEYTEHVRKVFQERFPQKIETKSKEVNS